MKSIVIATVLVTASVAQAATLPFAVSETGQSFSRLSDAVGAIKSSGTIIVAPGRYADCAVIGQSHIVIRAARAGTAIFDSGACEGKAALVLRGGDATVQGLTFRNMKNHEGNGAAIRLERGDLTVWGSRFEDSQQGILTDESPSSRVSILQSTFARLGRCDGGPACAHSIYIGAIGKLTVSRSRFEGGFGGHYIKSRAAVVDIRENLFDDRKGSTVAYMIDLSNGAGGAIVRNHIVRGGDAENHCCLITVAPEGRKNSSAGLSIRGNVAELAAGVPFKTTFIADWSGQMLDIGGNRLGDGIAPFTAM